MFFKGIPLLYYKIRNAVHIKFTIWNNKMNFDYISTILILGKKNVQLLIK